MRSYSQAVIARPDTLFGVCQALGEDLGFNPLILRVTLAVPLVWMPFQMFAVYAALGLVVLGSRLLFPNPRLAAVEPEAAAPVAAHPSTQPERSEELLLAA